MLEVGYAGTAYWVHKPTSRFSRPAEVVKVKVTWVRDGEAAFSAFDGYYFRDSAELLFLDRLDAEPACAKFNIEESEAHIESLTAQLLAAYRSNCDAYDAYTKAVVAIETRGVRDEPT